MSDESRLHEILEEDCIEDEEDGGREAECRWHGEDPGEKNAWKMMHFTKIYNYIRIQSLGH